jgi:hypothetical protein
MKLTFRGNSYESSAPMQISFDSTDRSSVKLLYRGNAYYTTSPSAIASQALATDEPRVTLIYRGNSYERKLQSLKPDRKSRAIDWRYQIPG